MKRLLCILSGMNAGGAETFLMKVYRAIDRTKYQFDFCINAKEECFYEKEITSLGGKFYRIPQKSASLRKFKKELYKVVKENGYEYVLRITSSAMGFMDLKIAKKAGAKVCVARSSNSGDGGTLKSLVMHSLGKILYIKYVDVKIAPSDLAAEYTFGEKAYKKGEVAVLHNAVDVNVYKFDSLSRKKIREEFEISDNVKLIGHIGRFSRQKNHLFLLKIYAEILKKEPNSILMLVGKGELENEIKAEIEKLGIENNVIFTGVRSDVPDLLSAMDVFVFPSFYEGMPNTVIEAQATGLPCVISDSITREANVTGIVDYLSLKDEPSVWAEKAIEKATEETGRSLFGEKLVSCRYDVQSTVDDFVKLIFKD